MTVSIDDFHAFLALAEEDDVLRQRLARLVYGDALAKLPDRFERLAASHERSLERFDHIEAALQRLAEAQARTGERLDRLAKAQARSEQRLDRVEERLDRVEAALQRLAEAQAATQEALTRLTERVDGLSDDMASVKGTLLEVKYRDKAMAYFGPMLRNLHIIGPQEMDTVVEPKLGRDEFRDVLLLDLVLSGKPRDRDDLDEVWLAVEISFVVDRSDVERARRRARLLASAGRAALPVVAGEAVTLGAEEDLESGDVIFVRDGRSHHWETALATLV